MTMTAIANDDSLEGQRRYDRAELHVEVSLESEHNFFVGFSENVSEGGLFVATHSLREMGSKVRLTFHLPQREQPVEIDAVVRWVRLYSESSDTPPGLGLQFVDLSSDDAVEIRRFVQRRAPLFWD